MRRIIILCFWSAILLTGIGLQQVQAAIELSMDLVSASNLEVYFLKDLNLSGEAPTSVIFRATINNTSDSTEHVYFKFIMRTSNMIVAEGSSNIDTLGPGIHNYTNLDLSDNSFEFYLTDYEINEEGSQEIQDKILETGYFPTDNYQLKLEVYSAANNDIPIADDELNLYLTNPFDIVLLSPNGTPGSPALLNNTTPLFSWSSSARQFLIKICEKTSEGMDPESIMNGRPLYETEPADPILTQSFVYPGSGVRPLEAGHSYYYQVTSLLETSSGQESYPSPIGAFTIISQLNPEALRIVEGLQGILGIDLESALAMLTGYQPNGTIRLDGMNISLAELETLAEKFESKEYKTTAVYAE